MEHGYLMPELCLHVELQSSQRWFPYLPYLSLRRGPVLTVDNTAQK